MHIIIVGCGRVGAQLSQILSQEGHNVVVIDKNPSSFKRLGSTFNGITIDGIGFDLEVLKRAGIEKADALAAVSSGDNSNIMIGQIAKKIFNVPKVVARISDPERAEIYHRYGLDTVSSTIINANIIKSSLLKETSSLTLPIGEDAVAIEYKLKGEK
jgi:trk system potassium uptake protein